MTAPDTVAVQVGRRIRALRMERGWSTSQLAAAVGVTRAAVNHWEVGRRWPKVPTLLDVADELGVDLYMLLSTRNRPDPDGDILSGMPWRTGRHWLRTIVTTTDPGYPLGRLIGVMGSAADAALAVAAVNAFDPCGGTGWVRLAHQVHAFEMCRGGRGGVPCPRCTKAGKSSAVPALPPGEWW
jgi:transcriptional regulator with XRE-family HTH domain